ncbi:hypothetical protein CONPUDRAFT_158800 [Coniophora puteana RWD-64-598 SS2]|uniref:Uncharacterized protein n=1 Tax=Coniophora puteana (strain RWD-64-598) TaxID=741705 RepID=A0A5M3MAX2_CONPW|nr:uncharacterized protein CONPUDRAFT_158800 [Coniophora puteana RWD-64-598 SS2]EIW76024.1 hypothetical protein CONPUDRAFT_158800 [Coniophora puteana RWD-64-598 SS2]
MSWWLPHCSKGDANLLRKIFVDLGFEETTQNAAGASSSRVGRSDPNLVAGPSGLLGKVSDNDEDEDELGNDQHHDEQVQDNTPRPSEQEEEEEEEEVELQQRRTFPVIDINELSQLLKNHKAQNSCSYIH